MRKIVSTALALFALAGGSASLAQDAPQAKQPLLHGYYAVRPLTRSVPAPNGARHVVTPLPSYTYTATASADLGGGTYTGTILGKAPVAPFGTTTLPVQIVPLVITITDASGTVTYDPTAADPCNGNHAAITVVKELPIFTKDISWKMNGIAIGKTQYIDAFQRAQSWSAVAGQPYHLLLKNTVLPSQSQTYSSGHGINYNAGANGGCGHIGIVNYGDMDARIQALITGPLAKSINAGKFPIFITKDVVESDPGVSINNCCILGYHGAFTVGGNLQIYSPFAFDSSGIFGGNVNTLAHEMGEAVNDPAGTNPTPTWGKIGQQGGCQNNFEVGDPLSAGFSSPTNPFTVVGRNGLTYTLQELAFYGWFYGNDTLGAGGKLSSNSTFGGHAILCSAGGGTH